MIDGKGTIIDMAWAKEDAIEIYRKQRNIQEETRGTVHLAAEG